MAVRPFAASRGLFRVALGNTGFIRALNYTSHLPKTPKFFSPPRLTLTSTKEIYPQMFFITQPNHQKTPLKILHSNLPPPKKPTLMTQNFFFIATLNVIWSLNFNLTSRWGAEYVPATLTFKFQYLGNGRSTNVTIKSTNEWPTSNFNILRWGCQDMELALGNFLIRELSL